MRFEPGVEQAVRVAQFLDMPGIGDDGFDL